MIGPAYWELCKNFDDLDARYVIEVPVGWNNISETVLWATSSWDVLNGTQRIDAIEIGNEVNAWPVGNFKPPEYVGAVNDSRYAITNTLRLMTKRSDISAAIPKSSSTTRLR